MADDFPIIIRKNEIQTMKNDLEMAKESPEKRDRFYSLRIVRNVLNKQEKIGGESMSFKDKAFISKQEEALKSKQEITKEINSGEEIPNFVKEVKKDVSVPKPEVEKEESQEIIKEIPEETPEETAEKKRQALKETLKKEALERIKKKSATVINKEPLEEKKIIGEKEKAEFYDKKKREIELRIRDLKSQETKAKEKRDYLLKEIEAFRTRNLEPLKLKEEEIESKKKSLDKKEETTSSVADEQQIEEARWKLEDERKEIEKQRWALEEQIEGNKKEIAKMDLSIQRIIIEEEELKQKQNRIDKAEQAVGLKKEQETLLEKLEDISNKTKPVKEKSDEIYDKLSKIGKELSVNLIREREIEKEIRDMEIKEKEIADTDERKSQEQRRWDKEKERRELEKKKWIQEREKQSLESEKNKIDIEYKKLNDIEEETKEKLSKINEDLGISNSLEEEMTISVNKNQYLEKEPKEEIITKEKDINSSTDLEPKEKTIDSKLEEVTTDSKKEEVITQEKEITKEPKVLEAPEEILAVSENVDGKEFPEVNIPQPKEESIPEESSVEDDNDVLIEIVDEEPQETEEDVIKEEPTKDNSVELEIERSKKAIEDIINKAKERDPAIQKELSNFPPVRKKTADIPVNGSLSEPKSIDKIKTSQKPIKKESKSISLKRIIIIPISVIILGFFISFFYWYFAIREKEVINTSEPIIETPQEIVRANNIIDFESTKTLYLEEGLLSAESFTSLINNRESELGTLTRVLVEDIASSTSWGIKEFFDNYEVAVPFGFYEKMRNNESNIFIYSAKNRNDFGFIIPLDNVVDSEMLSWESTLEGDMWDFYKLLGKETVSSESFKSAKAGNDNFRYISYKEPYLGACWSIKDNYLIFTSSGESMIKIFDKLEEK